MRRALFAVLALGLGFLLTGAADLDDDARSLAVKLTTTGAQLFDARDAKGLALTYAEDARLEIITRDRDTRELKTETRVGRNEIQSYYQEHFKSAGDIHCRNTVDHARLLDASLLSISGTFEPNTQTAESIKLPFIQVRSRQGDQWRIISLQLFVTL